MPARTTLCILLGAAVLFCFALSINASDTTTVWCTVLGGALGLALAAWDEYFRAQGVLEGALIWMCACITATIAAVNIGLGWPWWATLLCCIIAAIAAIIAMVIGVAIAVGDDTEERYGYSLGYG